MAGIYIHIPFCKQACHYCDFHFSTSLKLQQPLLAALAIEIRDRKKEWSFGAVNTIYLGGGTPSILEVDELKRLLELIYLNYPVAPDAEITLEANPDDLTPKKIAALRGTGINRFSIGVQSFFDEDLHYMNRAHNASEAETAIKASQDAGFENLTIDLIYGTPTLTRERWISNLRKSISFLVPHLSCYALTVEEKTPLAGLIRKKKLEEVSETQVADHFFAMAQILTQEGFEHYEISNFAKKSFRSRHNAAYWWGQAYLGFGPGAHSFNGFEKRRWNVSNNVSYIRQIHEPPAYYEEEILQEKDRANEFVMTRIRLQEGVSMDELLRVFGKNYHDQVLQVVDSWNKNWYHWQNNSLLLTLEGKIISDKLASDLFFL
jgi:oxygen-independent coproporphyrinogen-3 oxidase